MNDGLDKSFLTLSMNQKLKMLNRHAPNR